MAAKLTSTAPNGSMVLNMRGAGSHHGHGHSHSHSQSSSSGNGNGSSHTLIKPSGIATLSPPPSPSKKATKPKKKDGNDGGSSSKAGIDDPSTQVEVILVNLNQDVQPSVVRRNDSTQLRGESDLKVTFVRDGTKVVYAHHGEDKIVYLVEANKDGWEKEILGGKGLLQ